jgi:hypothetical protein
VLFSYASHNLGFGVPAVFVLSKAINCIVRYRRIVDRRNIVAIDEQLVKYLLHCRFIRYQIFSSFTGYFLHPMQILVFCLPFALTLWTAECITNNCIIVRWGKEKIKEEKSFLVHVRSCNCQVRLSQDTHTICRDHHVTGFTFGDWVLSKPRLTAYLLCTQSLQKHPAPPLFLRIVVSSTESRQLHEKLLLL